MTELVIGSGNPDEGLLSTISVMYAVGLDCQSRVLWGNPEPGQVINTELLSLGVHS